MRSRFLAGALVLALTVAACATGVSQDPEDPDPGGTSTTSGDGASTGPGSTPGTEGRPPSPAASALNDMNDPSFPSPLVDPSEIISGGPPPDGIPSIDDPQFVTVDEADEWLTLSEPVVYLEANGEVHAYPVQILIWHEIVNDTVGGIPVAVTYCPLCNSAVSYRREVDGVVTTFGTSGRLYASALVMYDRATESLWTHYDGRAVVGVLTGEVLEPLSSPLLGWPDFKAAFPDAMVLDRNATGFDRPYMENPYSGYDTESGTAFLFRGSVDDRAKELQRVVGVAIGDQARAWTLESISGGESRATNDVVGDTPIVILWKTGQASALETTFIAGGRDVGSVGVFSPVVAGRTLTFTANEGSFLDQETGSEWNITGSAISGELAGIALDSVHHLDTFWFAWSTYQPGTDLVDG